jgi:hypothetical protein
MTIPVTGTLRRSRDPNHGWRITWDGTHIGYAVHVGRTWTAKDTSGRPVRTGIDRQDDAESFLVGRYLASTGRNDCVHTLSAELVAAVAQITEATGRRDELVVAMRNAGATLQAIADASSLTPGGVKEVVRRMQGRRPAKGGAAPCP